MWHTTGSGNATPPFQHRQSPDEVYRIAGRGIAASAPFQLPKSNRRVDITGHVGTKGARIAGMVVSLVGLGNLALNSLVYASVDSTNASSSEKSANKDLFAVGIVIGGAAVPGDPGRLRDLRAGRMTRARWSNDGQYKTVAPFRGDLIEPGRRPGWRG